MSNKYLYKYRKYKKKYDNLIDLNPSEQIAGQNDVDKSNNKKIVSENLDGLTTNGPLIIEDTNITIKLLIHGTLDFTNLTVMGTTKIYGTVIGKNGTFNTFSVYGSINMDNCTIRKLLCTGSFFGEKISITDSSSIIGPTYIMNSKIKSLELISDDITINNSDIGVLIIHSSEPGIKTTFNGSTINTLIIKGKKLLIDTGIRTKIENIVNGEIAVLNE